MRRFKTGDRVTVNFWGEDRLGTVTDRNQSELVWVILDNGPIVWFHPESLALAP